MSDGFEEYDDVVLTPEERAMQDEFDRALTDARQYGRGKAQIRYNRSVKGKASRERYNNSEKRKETQKAYRQSEKGKEMLKRYSHSQSFLEAQKKYRQSEKGKAAAKRRLQQEIESGKNAERCRRYYQRKKLAMAE